jgi:hypothetical protein
MGTITSDSTEPFNSFKSFLINAKYEIVIFCPYINYEILTRLLPSNKIDITIVTTCKIRDMISGFSDINLFNSIESSDINLFINNRLHLKSLIIDWEKYIYGSANLTRSGLGVSERYNYELVSNVKELNFKIHVYFKKILSNSVLLNKQLLSKIKELYSTQKEDYMVQEPNFETDTNNNEFLISSLPMTKDIDLLYNIYENKDNKSIGDNDYKCALHDIALYNIPFGLVKEKFINHLKNEFFWL